MKFKDPLKILGIFLTVYLLQYQLSWAQCPKINDIRIVGREDSSICVPDLIQLSVDIDYLPSGAEVQWFSGNTPNFNPLLGEGDFIESEIISGLSFPMACPSVCPSLELLYTEPCNTFGSSYENEFVAIASGGGFYASDLRLEFDSKTNPSFEAVNNSIEIGADFCQIQEPNPALMSQLRQGACNSSNLIAAGPGDYIPPGAMVIFFLSSKVADDFDISQYCSVDEPIYILQNACTRNRSAFMTTGTCSGANRFMYQSISLKGCSACFDELNYDLCGFSDSRSSYVKSVDKALSSKSNGGVFNPDHCDIPSKETFFTSDTTLNLDVFLYDVNDVLCGQTVYYKVVLIPNENTCSSVVSEVFPLKVECPIFNIASFSDSVCSGTPLNINLNGPPNAIYSWEVNAPIEVSGLESNQNQTNQIIQTPLLDGSQEVQVFYDISIVSGTCLSSSESTQITVLPSIKSNIQGNLQFCKGQQTILSVESDQYQILWSTGATINNITVTEPGIYSVILSNGICEFLDTVEVEEVDQILPKIIGDSIICNNGNVTLSGPEGFDSYLWNTGSSDREIIINSSNYSLEVTLGDCKGSGNFILKDAIDKTVDVQIKPVGCTGVNDGRIQLEVDVSDDLISWNDGTTGKVLDNLAAGSYSYNIVRSSTCEISDTLEVSSSPILEPIFDVTGVGCVESELGSIAIVDVLNAIEPLSFSFNSGGFSSIKEWNLLETGSYTINIIDGGGCKKDSIILVDEGFPLIVSMNDTIEVVQGSSFELEPEIEGIDENMSFYWIPSEGLSCSDCLNPIFNALENMTYQFIAVNSKGCRDSVLIDVKVIPKVAINIPQAFSPNNDGVNDKFQILSTSEDIFILRFNIFNRWGENVFSVSNFKVGDTIAAWDGTISGKLVPADSYLYEVEFQSLDSSVTIERGVVTLIK